jgi:hypothetical protein
MKKSIVISVVHCLEWACWFARYFSCGHGEVVPAEELPLTTVATCRICTQRRVAVEFS